MKRWKTGLAVAAAGIALGGHAQAAALYTAPASVGYGGETLLCDAANVGPTPVIMTIELRTYLGNNVDSVGPFQLAPGEVVSHASSAANAAYCKFTVVGNTKKIRAQAIYAKSNGSRTIVVPAK
jgi:hypothetical protein